MPRSRAASSRTYGAERRAVWTNASGSSIERSTWDSAAKLTTASQPSIALATALGSSISPSTNRSARRPRQVLAPAGVGELVEHHDLVAGLGAQAHVGRADEPGAAGDEQLHRPAVLSVGRCGEVAGEPSCQAGSRIACSRSLASTEKAGRGAGRPSILGGRRQHRARRPGLRRRSRARTRTRSSARRRPCGGCRTRRRSIRRTSAGGQVPGVGRAADLVADDQTSPRLGGQPQHRVDEVRAADAEQPGGADDRVVAGWPRRRALSPASLVRP